MHQKQQAVTDAAPASVFSQGAGFDDVVTLRVYLTDPDHFAVMNDADTAFVTEHCPSGVLPARTAVFTRLPNAAVLVEIDGLAVV